MKATLKYSCGECGELHDDEVDAAECCPPEIWKAYVCGHCGENHHYDEEAAEECCADVDPDAPQPIDKAELEAAGQMRLSV